MRKPALALVLGGLLLASTGCNGGAATPTPTYAGQVPTLTPAMLSATTTATYVPGTATCRAVPPAGTVVTGLPSVTEEDWVRGPATATLTLIEYADFQCPGCAGMLPTVEHLVDVHGDNLRFVYRHYPLTTIHDKALITAIAAEAAGAQGAFWEMYELLYDRYRDWSGLPADQMPAILTGYAEELGLDVDRFSRDLQNQALEDRVLADYQEARSLGLPGTPTFIVNGRMLPIDQWGLSYQTLDAFLSLQLLAPRQYDSPPPEVIDPNRQYQATIRTAKGDIVIELYAAQAPANVNSFVFLAREGWYDGLTFFRVIPDFVAQAGDPLNVGIGNPGYQCDDEIDPNLHYDAAGVVGIANARPGTNTGSCQFFITLAPQPSLDGGYTIIGRVVEGLDVLQSISPHDPSDRSAPPGDVIETIIIEEQ